MILGIWISHLLGTCITRPCLGPVLLLYITKLMQHSFFSSNFTQICQSIFTYVLLFTQLTTVFFGAYHQFFVPLSLQISINWTSITMKNELSHLSYPSRIQPKSTVLCVDVLYMMTCYKRGG